MDANIITQAWEQGIIYGLFVLIVMLFIWKGVPFIVGEFKTLREDFLKALKDQQETFEKTLNSISNDFVKRVEQSENWHEKHSKELSDIKDIISKK